MSYVLPLETHTFGNYSEHGPPEESYHWRYTRFGGNVLEVAHTFFGGSFENGIPLPLGVLPRYEGLSSEVGPATGPHRPCTTVRG